MNSDAAELSTFTKKAGNSLRFCNPPNPFILIFLSFFHVSLKLANKFERKAQSMISQEKGLKSDDDGIVTETLWIISNRVYITMKNTL